MPDHYVSMSSRTEKAAIYHSKKEIKISGQRQRREGARRDNQTIATYVTSMGGDSVQVPMIEGAETLKRGVTRAITVPWNGSTTRVPVRRDRDDLHARRPALRIRPPAASAARFYNGLSDGRKKKAVDKLCTPSRCAARLQALVRGWDQTRGRNPQDRSQADQGHPRRAEALARCRQADLRGVGGSREAGGLRSRRGVEESCRRAAQGRRLPLARHSRARVPAASFRRAQPSPARELVA